jgi:hypothetical protein
MLSGFYLLAWKHLKRIQYATGSTYVLSALHILNFTGEQLRLYKL